MMQRKLLRDHPAHRDAVDRGLFDPECAGQIARIFRHGGDGVRSIGLVGVSSPAIIEVNAVEARHKRQRRRPCHAGQPEAHYEQERLARSEGFVVEIYRACFNPWHQQESIWAISYQVVESVSFWNSTKGFSTPAGRRGAYDKGPRRRGSGRLPKSQISAERPGKEALLPIH